MITVKDIIEFLPKLEGIEEERLQYALNFAIKSITEPCNDNVAVVSWFVADYLTNTGELAGKESYAGAKSIKTGDEQVTYKDEASVTSYKDRYNDSLNQCLSENSQDSTGTCGNIFII